MRTKFTFDDRDEFQRKKIAEKVIQLLRSPIDVSPMVIDGDWGTGKTEFCHKLINWMKTEDHYHIIYVDAFNADHANEPLLTVLAEVIKVLPNDEAQNTFIQKALPAVRYGLKALAKAGVAHLLRQDATDVANDFDKEIQQAANQAIDTSVESLLKDHVKASESLLALQTALKEIAAEKPMILFIDELDRCRPDFAINMLEIIKHTFDVEGVQFVLVTNTKQLKASINHCYGPTVDAQRYLDKFLKFSFALPIVIPEQYEKTLAATNHFVQLVQNSETLANTQLHQDADLSFIRHIIQKHDVSLREVETLVRYFEIYQVLTEQKALASNIIFGYKLLRLLGVSIFCLAPELANSILKGKSDAQELANFLGETQLPEFSGGYPYPKHHQVLLTMLAQECHYHSGAYTPADEKMAAWEELISSYFARGGFPPSKGERHKIVTEAISVLGLAV
ncbi:KAP family P-loop NTPase fold protein [Photobacterium lipolyticum]|uniref:AAA family ATPase n=1 Tax=Photobacterium lipolyticum TaxID=266810 RepID=A0A2T3N164_9GAMM|nr:KAP family NTPase [Photobacterium lipolyticum]PSW06060.1 AAA family ATPase [Photobacterium lipolyticum]